MILIKLYMKLDMKEEPTQHIPFLEIYQFLTV